MGGELTALAADAYIYGFPLITDLRQVSRFRHRGLGSLAPAPFNTFSHARALAGLGDRFVSINNDGPLLLYSIAQIDLSSGPLVLRVPDAAGRYYVLQFVDAWTNNFAYVGRRATGTSAGSFRLVPPGWPDTKADTAPDAMEVIEFPTRVGTIVGRWACDGVADLPAVRDLQRGLSLVSEQDDGPPDGIPAPAAVPADLAFFEQLRTWSQAFPPSTADQEYQRQFAPLGLLDPVSTYPDAPPELAQALAEGAKAGRQEMAAVLKARAPRGLSPVVNGWTLTYHAFDYNLDHLGLGTLDDPTWKLADRTASYLVRALAARADLWGSHGYEAACSMTYTDSDGDRLDGRSRYVLRLDQPPPVAAFWSITMYDLPDFYLVANPIGRYSIGDRTPGLRRDADGSITIQIQHEPPADTSNWLPAPPAPFRLIMRLYQPGDSVLDGSYQIPPIRKSSEVTAGRP